MNSVLDEVYKLISCIFRADHQPQILKLPFGAWLTPTGLSNLRRARKLLRAFSDSSVGPVEQENPTAFPSGQVLSTRWTTDFGRELKRAPKRLLIVHVPKTGGTTLRVMFGRHVEQKHTFLSTGQHEWKSASPTELAKHSLFTGHNFFEPIYALPSSTWVTVLLVRDPVEWWTSFYKFLRREDSRQGLSSAMLSLSLQQWLDGLSTEELSNPQSSWLLQRIRKPIFSSDGDSTAGTSFEHSNLPVGERTAILKPLLASITVVGTTDSLHAAYEQTCHAMGWKPKLDKAPRENASTASEDLLAIDDNCRQRLLAHNQLDLMMYQMAAKRQQTPANANH